MVLLPRGTLRLCEVLAEVYGEPRVHGLEKAFGAYRFPVDMGYITLAQMAAEGQAIGTITLGGLLFYVRFHRGRYRGSNDR